MEWSNVSYYEMQRIMREIYYNKWDEKDKDELNKFELENYKLYKTGGTEIFNKMFFIKKQEETSNNIITKANVNENIAKICCYNNTNKKKVPYEYLGRKSEPFIPYENKAPFNTIKIDKLNNNYQLEDVTICEKYKNKYVILMFVSYEDEVGEYNNDKNNNTPYIKKVRKTLPVIRILDENKQLLFEKYFYSKTYTKDKHKFGFFHYWFNQFLFHLNNFIFILEGDIVKLNIDNYEVIENNIAYSQGITAQNKTNLLYVGRHNGTVKVLNIKTLQPVKTIIFYDVDNKKQIGDVDILSLKMVWDTLYVYAFEDWNGGIDRIFTIDNVNDIQEEDNKKQLLYDSTELPCSHFSKYIEQYGKYLYISNNCLNGALIFDTNTKKYVRMAETILSDHYIYNNIFKIQDHYLIISRWYEYNHTEEYTNHTEMQIFDVENDPLLHKRNYELRFTNKLISINIIENYICIEYLKEHNIVMERIAM